MRWLVVFLIILNALIYVWFSFEKQYNQVDESVQAAAFDFSSAASLKLLQELPEQELQARDRTLIAQQEAAAAASVEAAESAGSMCWVVGSYPEVVSARQARIDLNDEGVPSRIVQMDEALPAVNWVYIPAQPTEQASLALLRQLQQKKIDSFLVTEEGEYKNAISLGFYGAPGSAEKVMQLRKEQGYDAHLTQRVRMRKALWLAIDDAAVLQQEKLADKLNFVLNAEKDVKKKEISCEKLALLASIQ